jgi:hypothetical protein
VVLLCVTLLLIFAGKETGLLQRSQDPQITYSPFLERLLATGRRGDVSDKQKETLQQLQPLSNVVVATMVVLATDPTAKWNVFRGVNFVVIGRPDDSIYHGSRISRPRLLRLLRAHIQTPLRP